MLRVLCAACLVWIACLTVGADQINKQIHAAGKMETGLKLDIEGKGSVVIRLFDKMAPKTTAQIERLVRSGFYNGLRFHRVEKTPKPYIVQVGDPASRSGDLDDPKFTGLGGSGTAVPYEDSGHENVIGAVGLAHTVQDQDTGDSQFYIAIGTDRFLDGHYTVFGQVLSGMDVVQRIERGDRITSASIVTLP
jgi:cyclophilin family peptidyl-prolyl cis-trans isomerase